MPLSRGTCGGFSGNGGLVGECMLQNLQETKTPDEKSQTSGNQRHLQQSSSTVIEVSNGAQLVQAVAQGVKDIVITEHIDLTALPLPLQCDSCSPVAHNLLPSPVNWEFGTCN